MHKNSLKHDIKILKKGQGQREHRWSTWWNWISIWALTPCSPQQKVIYGILILVPWISTLFVSLCVCAHFFFCQRMHGFHQILKELHNSKKFEPFCCIFRKTVINWRAYKDSILGILLATYIYGSCETVKFSF